MLINKGLTLNDVVTIKLTSGEELVARFVEETDTHYRLNKVMVLTMDQRGLGMVPYLFTVEGDRDVSLTKGTITVIMTSSKESADQYLTSTTGIKLA